MSSYTKKLFQPSRVPGKVKWLEISVVKDTLTTTWWVGDADPPDTAQEVAKKCTGKNIGKANELLPAEQAIKEAEAKVKEKMEDGYMDVSELKAIKKGVALARRGTPDPTKPIAAIVAVKVDEISLDDLPKPFCPCKPISQEKIPAGLLDRKDLIIQEKRNGHCLIFTKNNKGEAKVYSRTMEDITLPTSKIPVISKFTEQMPNGCMILTEMVYSRLATTRDGSESKIKFHPDDRQPIERDFPRMVGTVVRKKDPDDALQAYASAVQEGGRYQIALLDVMFSGGKFCGDQDYQKRSTFIHAVASRSHEHVIVPRYYTVEQFKDPEFMKALQELRIEGFVLRVPESHITYSLDGKAHKDGSWKWKFRQTDDFIITWAKEGKSGKQAEFYAQFGIAQYYKGKLVEFGKAGPGELSHEDLRELTKKIKTGEYKLGEMVAEIEFQSREDDSGACQFPIIQRIRYDKRPEDCLCEEEFTNVK